MPILYSFLSAFVYNFQSFKKNYLLQRFFFLNNVTVANILDFVSFIYSVTAILEIFLVLVLLLPE